MDFDCHFGAAGIHMYDDVADTQPQGAFSQFPSCISAVADSVFRPIDEEGKGERGVAEYIAGLGGGQGHALRIASMRDVAKWFLVTDDNTCVAQETQYLRAQTLMRPLAPGIGDGEVPGYGRMWSGCMIESASELKSDMSAISSHCTICGLEGAGWVLG